jgi:hypothetical protein
MAHDKSKKQAYLIPQDQSEGFPEHRRQTPRQLAPAELTDLIMHDTAEIAGKLDIPINVVIQESFHDYLVKVMGHAIRLIRLSPGMNLAQTVPIFSHGRMSEELRSCGLAAYNERLYQIRQNHRFVNLICDAGTVMTIKVVQSAVSNPTRFERVLPLEPHPNTNWDADEYEAFFRDTVTKLTANNNGRTPLEICGIICDNLPAQVAGLRNFLSSQDGIHTGIFHVRCLNHMINLVFKFAIRTDEFVDVVRSIPELVHILNTAESVELTGRRCPRIVPTRWVYLVDVMGFILNRLPTVQTALLFAQHAEMAENHGLAYLVLLPLALFSRVVETKSRILGDVIPAAQEVLREWSDILGFFGDRPGVREMLHVVTAHFLARLRRNSFDVVLTADAVTMIGRAKIRATEAGIRTTGKIHPVAVPAFVSEMHQEFAAAMNAQQHLRAVETAERTEVPNPLEELDELDPEMIAESELPEPSQDFRHLLEEALTNTLEERLGRDLADGILEVIQHPIDYLSECLGYSAVDFQLMLREWWENDDEGADQSCHPDQYWRRYHGRSHKLGSLARVALRFITLGCSEADIERLRSEEKHFQGVHGTNYRMDTLQAREILREPRHHRRSDPA